ncbi:MAG TPA: VWA domain-containing protein [Candidatus Acidoferrales bacterium]|nr:VWA domain-containing protein [Candidatus Acidoferrales bacterium]
MPRSAKARTPATFRRLVLAAALLCASALHSQQAPANSAPPVLRASSKLVLVDVIVYDKHGNHATDLTAADFTLHDHGKQQNITVFSDEHAGESPAQKAALPPPPPLPLQVFTNRPEYVRSNGPPTILLLDALNTAAGDQASARSFLLQYLRAQAKNSQGIAILELSESLGLLQDFTTDPALLVAALEKYKPGISAELSGSATITLTPIQASVLPQLLRNLDRMNQSMAAEGIDHRVATTLAALRSIARALDGIPGRKNLIWVSSVFPISLMPGPDYPDAQRDYGDDLRRTAAMLGSARVAVYTVDARGISIGDVPGPMRSSGPLADTVQDPSDTRSPDEKLANSQNATLDSHQTMGTLAEDTGGMAIYNSNDINKAVALSANDGGQYYTLGYYPDPGNWDGKFHRIKLKLERKGLTARYRSGYFAVDATQPPPSESPQQRDRRAFEEVRAALNDPLPATQVTFRVHVPDPEAAVSAQVQIQFLVDVRTLSFDTAPNGERLCSLDFMAAAVTAEGKPAAADGKSVDAHLKPDQFARYSQDGLPFAMQLTLVPGSYSLQIVVRDNRTGLLGTLNVPLIVPAAPTPSAKPQ